MENFGAAAWQEGGREGRNQEGWSERERAIEGWLDSAAGKERREALTAGLKQAEVDVPGIAKKISVVWCLYSVQGGPSCRGIEYVDTFRIKICVLLYGTYTVVELILLFQQNLVHDHMDHPVEYFFIYAHILFVETSVLNLGGVQTHREG